MDGNKDCDNDKFNTGCQIKSSPSVDIEFQDLTYLIRGRDEKYILRAINGKFCSGELTGILGASGAGKTSLLNILNGYIFEGVTGNILTNGMPLNINRFRKVSTYIMQEDLLQPLLSVDELMMMAAKLKLGEHISLLEKKATVIEVLRLLGLTDTLETRTEYLSGGQRKRLSIALEMINNPPVVFLDEPTSGLDIVSVKQCMEVLKSLTGQGRTVICTIHQPSSSTFQYFDQVYFLEDGMCVYNGSTSNIVPFMASVGFECPITHSPPDYIIETVQSIKKSGPLLACAIKNGKVNKRNSIVPTFSKHNSSTVWEPINNEESLRHYTGFPTSFWTQFCIIFSRMMLQTARNRTMIFLQILYYFITAPAVGAFFYQIGNNGLLAITNAKFCIAIMVFYVFTHLISTVILFPFEVQFLEREYRNRWFGLKPYFLAVNLKNLPLMIPFGVVFAVVVYTLTDQPLETHRLIKFAITCLLTSIASEGYGLVIGSVFSATNGSAVAPMSLPPLVLLSIYGMGYGATVNLGMKIIACTSYLRWVLASIIQALFSDRSSFYCPEEQFCYYHEPKDLLKMTGFDDISYTVNTLGLIGFIVLFKLTAFILLRLRFTSQTYSKVVHKISRVLAPITQ